MNPPRMTAAALLSLLLSACDSGTSVPKDSYQTLTPGANSVSSDKTTSVKLPLADWTVSENVSWLSVTTTNQYGLTYAQLSIDPLMAVSTDAQMPSASTTFTFASSKGTYVLKVTVPLTLVAGAVPATVQQQASLPAETSTAPAESSGIRSVVVTSRRVLELGANQLHAQRLMSVASVGEVTTVIKTANPAETLKRVLEDPNTQRAFIAGKMHAQALDMSGFSVPDPFGKYQWYLPKIGYDRVLADHPENYKNPVTVAVLDTGVRYDHPDLKGRLLSGAQGAMDFAFDPSNGDGDGVDTDPSDPSSGSVGSHGTAVAGLIAANSDQIGVAGATLNAPVKILPIRVLGTAQEGDTADVMLAMRYAAGEKVTIDGKTYQNPNPAQIINLSLGVSDSQMTEADKAFVCESVNLAAARGALIVAAAGNSGRVDTYYPAGCPATLAVGAVTLNSQLRWQHAAYSATGPHIDIAAPGGSSLTYYAGLSDSRGLIADGLFTTVISGPDSAATWGLEEGTSFATPLVSAAAALVMSKGQVTSAADVRTALVTTADDVETTGQDNLTGSGVLNVARALGLMSGVTPTPTPTPSNRIVSIKSADGQREYRPPVQSDGRWKAYLAPGTYNLTGGVDANGNGLLEAGELTTTKTFTVVSGASQQL